MKIIFFYIAVGLFVVSGIFIHSWYIVSFRKRIGNKKFTIFTIFDLVLFMAILYVIGLDVSSSLKIFIMFLYIAGGNAVVLFIYRKAGLNKGIETDAE